MSGGIKVVGAGVGRTGTMSLKAALERLLGGPCYHMYEVIEHHMDTHVPIWTGAIRGEPVDWRALLDGYDAIVDWPGASFWRELSTAYPDALVLLSTRADAATWIRSARATILRLDDDRGGGAPPLPKFVRFGEMVHSMFDAWEPNWRDDEAAMAAYERHNAAVRAEVPPERLVEWQPGDGWEPLAAALGVPVPDEPFPHTNTTDDFRARMAQRAADAAEEAAAVQP